MKLSDYKGEDALELLANLIEPVGKIMSDKNVFVAAKENKFKAISIAIRNYKKELVEIMALLDGVPVEEYKVNFFTLPMKLLDILNDPELQNLFTYQGQMGDANSSGSASENIEE